MRKRPLLTIKKLVFIEEMERLGRFLSALAALVLLATSPSAGSEMNVHLKVIPHSQQRYDTVGDWHFTKASNLEIRVTRLSDRR